MEAIRNVLVTDASGAPSTRHRLVVSTDWDEVQHWCRQVYMPYNAAPVGSYRKPDSKSSWISLLSYVCRCITEMPDAVEHGPLGRHLEESIGPHLLTLWRQQMHNPQEPTLHRLAPRHVLAAEQHMRDHGSEAPTLSELARSAGVSVRTLNAAFREYRGRTPMQVLREIRLNGVRAELLVAPAGTTVRDVAEAWSYVNLGMFAAGYRQRFGESPSATLAGR